MRATFKIEKQTETTHLWVVISEVTEDGGMVMVNMTSLRGNAYRSCEIAPGEHPFFTGPTVIAYQHAKVAPKKFIDEMRAQPTHPRNAPQ